MTRPHEPSAEREERLQDILAVYLEEQEAGRAEDRQELLARYPEFTAELAEFFAGGDRLDGLAAPLRQAIAPGPDAVPPPPDGNPAALGDFRLLREVGRGGMGVVYEAEQLSLGRRVALKVLPFAATMDPRRLQRFHNEARAAASLDHPHIVKVHAVGQERGVHFFAMQFIDGQSLAELIRSRGSRIEDRGSKVTERGMTPAAPAEGASTVNASAGAVTLRSSILDPPSSVFRRVAEWGIQAAEALEYAHALGVVHRDVKPGNLLLDARGALWVTDFGLARTAADTGLTMTGDLLGTLRYMSPEQALAQHGLVDHRTDVYSLGATLYELLTSRPAVEGKDREEILRRVSWEEPRPPRALDRSIPRDLETIVLKCLEKDPARRYATAAALAGDLRRYLEDQPIQARRPTAAQRAAKWARRHQALVWAAAVVLAVTVPVLAASTAWALYMNGQADAALQAAEESAGKARDQATIAEWEKDQAQASERRATEAEMKAVAKQKEAEAAGEAEKQANELAQKRLGQIEKANAILTSIFRDLNPLSEEKGGPKLKEQLLGRLDQAAAQLEEDAIGDPVAVAELQLALGQTYVHLGEAPKAIGLLGKARQTLQAKFGLDHPDTLESMHSLALGYRHAGKFDLALPLYEETLKLRRDKLGPDHPHTLNTMNSLAVAYRAAGKLELALPLYKETLKLAEAKLGPDHHLTLDIMNNLAVGYLAAGKLDLALPLLDKTLELQKVKLGPDHPDTLTSMNNLGAGYVKAGKLELALPLLEETLKLRKAKLSPDHPQTLNTMNNLAQGYEAAGKLELAVPLYEDALKGMKAKLGPGHPRMIAVTKNLALAYQKIEGLDLDRAEPLLRELLELRKKNYGPESPDAAAAMARLGLTLLKQKEYDQAEPLLRECLVVSAKNLPDSWLTFNTRSQLGGALLGLKKYEDAEPLLLEGYEGMKQRQAAIPPQGKVRLAEAAQRLVDLYEAWGRPEQAQQWRKTLEQEKGAAGPRQP
jgi:serine/threonine protein kinase